MSLNLLPTKDTYFICVREGVASISYTSVAGTAISGTAVSSMEMGSVSSVEASHGPFPSWDAAHQQMQRLDFGWYAYLYSWVGGGPYEGEYEMRWVVNEAARPHANARFACGPFLTETEAQEAKALFEVACPVTWEEFISTDEEMNSFTDSCPCVPAEVIATLPTSVDSFKEWQAGARNAAFAGASASGGGAA